MLTPQRGDIMPVPAGDQAQVNFRASGTKEAHELLPTCTDGFIPRWCVGFVPTNVGLSCYADRRHSSPLWHQLSPPPAIKLDRLTPQTVQEMLNERLSAGFSPKTVRYVHQVLRSALTMAKRWDLVDRNVAMLVDPPQGEKTKDPPAPAGRGKALPR